MAPLFSLIFLPLVLSMCYLFMCECVCVRVLFMCVFVSVFVCVSLNRAQRLLFILFLPLVHTVPFARLDSLSFHSPCQRSRDSHSSCINTD